MMRKAKDHLNTLHKNQYPLIIILCGGLMILLGNCNFRSNKISAVVTQKTEIEYEISKSDSHIHLQFYNCKITDLKISDIQLNNHTVSYAVKSEGLILIPADLLALGKNDFKFIYQLKNITDTIPGVFFNLMDLDFVVTNSYPHNPTYFTEGLLFDNSGNLIESTGIENNSRVFFYQPMFNGYKVRDSIVNSNNEFGEGIAVIDNQLIQLLWKNKYIKIYNKNSLKFIRNIEYQNEGWGLCTNGTDLYASNGTSVIYKIDVGGSTTRVLNTISVQDQNGRITNINELEWVDGYLFANIWQTNFIYIIDPKTGYLVGKLDLTTITEKEKRLGYIDVLNGIAWNKTNNTILVTGKYWHNFYELKLNRFTGKSKTAMPLTQEETNAH